MTAYPAVGSQFGRYRITGVLGQGGMGVVFSAVHDPLGRKVALKVLSGDLASRAEFRRRFEREANALARLYSPHIIDVYDYGEIDDWLFIATQLVAGRDLRDWLTHDGPMPPRQALGVIAQVAAALSDAHDAGIIHRDIKPSNILLHQSTDELFAYVCDFGISRTDDEERTRTSGVIGTYAYMAPERHEGSQATVASDIYSLGCLLHAALTGRAPYQGTDVQVAMQHLHGDIPTYDGPEPTRSAINGIYRRCLAKNPDERYRTMGELRSDLFAAQQTIPESRSALAQSGHAAVPTGSPMSAQSAMVATPGSASGSRPRTWRWLLAASGLVGLLAVVGAAILVVPELLSQDPSCPSGTTVGADGGCQTSAEKPQTDDPVTCWDGATVDRLGDCSQPAGRMGLRWIFPSLDRDFEGCYHQLPPIGSSLPSATLRIWFCPIPGSRVEGIEYREWSSVEAAKAHFNGVYGHEPTEFIIGGWHSGYRWTQPEPNANGFYKVTSLYKDVPFSSTVVAASAPNVEKVCAGMTARPLQTFRTEPVGCRVNTT